MSRVERDIDDYKILYEEQINFLKKSAKHYDEGDLSEAKRMALQIRVLLHDTRNSTSLLTHLNKKQTTYFLDTAFDHDPKNLLTHSGLTIMRISSGEGSTFEAALDSRPPHIVKWSMFQSWWDKIIIVDNQQNKVTRRDLILTVSNQDGGAHVDSEIEKFYADITKGNSLGWLYSDGITEKATKGVESAAIRQITHEVLRSLEC